MGGGQKARCSWADDIGSVYAIRTTRSLEDIGLFGKGKSGISADDKEHHARYTKGELRKLWNDGIWKGAAMEIGVISAMGIGAIVVLAAPVLVWALVVTGLRQVTKNARNERQRDMQPGKVDAA